MKLSLTLIVSLLAAVAQEKTYDLKLDAKPIKGQKAELADSSVMKMTMKMTGLPEPMNMGEESSYAATQEVLSAEADGSSVKTWTFSKASKTKEGQAAPLSFQGKTVTVKHTKGKPREFSLEGGAAIAAEDLSALRKAFMGGDDKPGEPSGADMFAPKKPVKVGESWNPDIKLIAKSMFDSDMAEALDLEKSSCKLTLKSVESRAGADFGKIEGLLVVTLGQFGPMKLDTPMALKLQLDLDACIDGKVPDGQLKLKAEMKGKTSSAGPNGKVDIEIDMSMTGQMSARSLK
jgi:hypothetical protein